MTKVLNAAQDGERSEGRARERLAVDKMAVVLARVAHLHQLQEAGGLEHTLSPLPHRKAMSFAIKVRFIPTRDEDLKARKGQMRIRRKEKLKA